MRVRQHTVKCIVIYFSQTGNTEKIAAAIQAGVKQVAGHCDIVKIKDANPNRLYDYDLIGIGSVAFGTEPTNVSDFIKNMHFVGGKHAFAFSTHGSTPEPFFPNIVPKMKRRGLTVIGMGDWYGDCTLLHHMDPYPTAGHPDEIDLKEAEDFGREMVERSRRIAAGETHLIPPVPPREPPLQIPLGPERAGKKKGEKDLIESFSLMMKYHREKCLYPKCRLCMENCPVFGIDLSRTPPVLAKPCLMCEFCARICPTGALDIDNWVAAVAKETAEIMVPRVILPTLEKAEAEGRFRRLVPKEKLRLDTYGYMVHKKHPQWIIGKGRPR
jgi:flavodoxin/Fe-S-cluster-containing hydrogenase component 2